MLFIRAAPPPIKEEFRSRYIPIHIIIIIINRACYIWSGWLVLTWFYCRIYVYRNALFNFALHDSWFFPITSDNSWTVSLSRLLEIQYMTEYREWWGNSLFRHAFWLRLIFIISTSYFLRIFNLRITTSTLLLCKHMIWESLIGYIALLSFKTQNRKSVNLSICAWFDYRYCSNYFQSSSNISIFIRKTSCFTMYENYNILQYMCILDYCTTYVLRTTYTRIRQHILCTLP